MLLSEAFHSSSGERRVDGSWADAIYTNIVFCEVDSRALSELTDGSFGCTVGR